MTPEEVEASARPWTVSWTGPVPEMEPWQGNESEFLAIMMPYHDQVCGAPFEQWKGTNWLRCTTRRHRYWSDGALWWVEPFMAT